MPSRNGAGFVVMKNCDPFVFGPLFAYFDFVKAATRRVRRNRAVHQRLPKKKKLKDEEGERKR